MRPQVVREYVEIQQMNNISTLGTGLKYIYTIILKN